MTTIANKQQIVKTEVLDVLRRGSTKDLNYFLPSGQLDRKLYQEVNEVLERIGGKWNRKAKAHIFEIDPAALLELVSTTGEMPPKNPTAYFPTPENVVAKLLCNGIPKHVLHILEPSAGKGNIAEAMRSYCEEHNIDVYLDCCEIVPRFRDILKEKGFVVLESDFLQCWPEYRYDFIAMNPPFAIEGDAHAYVTHVEHAWELLAPDGILKSVVPAGFAFREDKRIAHLRNQVEQYGSWEELEDRSFDESGTGVRTVLISMKKPA
jgi:Methyltransferase small domain